MGRKRERPRYEELQTAHSAVIAAMKEIMEQREAKAREEAEERISALVLMHLMQGRQCSLTAALIAVGLPVNMRSKYGKLLKKARIAQNNLAEVK